MAERSTDRLGHPSSAPEKLHGTEPVIHIRDVGGYLGVTHQRADQMFHEGRFPEPEEVDGIGPQWKQATIERRAELEWRGTRKWRKRPN
jgi:hypothetical protein